MKALTIHQPYASLIMAGAKPFEFRSRRPPAALIGQRIAIHASARKIHQPLAVDLFLAVRDQTLRTIITATLDPARALPILARAWEPDGEPLPISAGLGTAIIGEPRRVIEIADGPGYPVVGNEPALWGWPMLEIKPWPIPIPMRGKQGLWNWPTPADVIGGGQ